MVQTELVARTAAVETIENSDAFRAYLRLMTAMSRGREALAASQGQDRPQCHALLKELSLIVPEHLSLTAFRLSLENNLPTVFLDGDVTLTDFSPEIVLAEYVAALEKSAIIDNVRVIGHRKERRGDGFRLSFQLKMGAKV
jgi:hypothetical protein